MEHLDEGNEAHLHYCACDFLGWFGQMWMNDPLRVGQSLFKCKCSFRLLSSPLVTPTPLLELNLFISVNSPFGHLRGYHKLTRTFQLR